MQLPLQIYSTSCRGFTTRSSIRIVCLEVNEINELEGYLERIVRGRLEGTYMYGLMRCGDGLSFVAVYGLRREGRRADRDVFGSAREGRGVAHPFSGVSDDALDRKSVV